MGGSETKDLAMSEEHYPHFIKSAPLGVDMLEGKAQEQIADSVVRLISEDETENRLIGLDGAWGSGKSNLIKIIESKLARTHCVYCHDAWGHQEDLHRRAFLEELTAKLCSDGILDSEEWKQKLKDLLARKRETRTKTVPRISHGVLATVLVTILTPIAGTIADGIQNLWWRFVVSVLPLLGGILWWLAASLRAGRLLGPNEIYRIYKDKEVENETHVTISESEPSVRQFRDWMRDLSSSLTKKKLVVVFDNMDRLPPEKVRELWGSIHTFFAEDVFESIWVIVPFDRTHICAAFEGDREISDQFLSKSFSVIYRVPPPVLTDWQHFFEVKFAEAFGELQDGEAQACRRVFDLLQDFITPRSIIAFINELVSLCLVVETTIGLRYIAVFVLAKKDILAAPVDQILSLDFLKKADAMFRGDRAALQNSIAALVYHVPIASASQVSLTRQISNALRDTNIARFNELAKHLHFLDILEQVIGDGETEIPNAAETLAGLDNKQLEDETILARVTAIWDILCDQFVRVPLKEQEFTVTHQLLLKNSSASGRSALRTHLVDAFRNAVDFSGAKYFNALSSLSSYAEENGLGIDVPAFVPEMKKEPEIFAEYMQAAQKDYKKFKLKCEGAALNELIVGRIPDGVAGYDALALAKSEYDFSPVVERLEQIAKETTLTLETLVPVYNLYKAIAPDRPIKSLADAHVNTLLSQAKEKSPQYYELVAMRLARADQYPHNSGVAVNVLSASDEKTVEEVAQRIQFYAAYGTLLSRFAYWAQPLLKGALRNLTLGSYGQAKMTIEVILPHFKTLYAALEVSAEDFLNRLNDWVQHAEKGITAENINEVVPDVEFFEYAIEVENRLTKHCMDCMVESLNGLALNEWSEALHDEESYVFEVTYWLLKGGQLKEPPANAVSAYKEVLTETAAGESAVSRQQMWDTFYDRTNKNRLKPTFKNIRDRLISNASITTEIFTEFGEKLIAHGELKEKSADVARTILAPVADNEDCLSLIVENADFFVPLVQEAGDDADDLKDIIRQRLSAQPSNKQLAVFAQRLGLISSVEAVPSEQTEEEEQPEG